MSVSRHHIVAEAEKLIGVRWVHQGRDPERGLDCVGVPVTVALRLGIIAPEDAPRADYGRRPDGTFLARFRATPLIEILPTQARPGDVLVFVTQTAPCHCGILTEKDGAPAVIHAYAAARKVVCETLASARASVGPWTHAFRFPNLKD